MGVMKLGYQIIKNFLQIANDDSVFMICNTLIDLGVVYVASFYLEQLCSHFWFILKWFDLFPFLRGVKCETLLVPYLIVAAGINITIFLLQKVRIPSKIVSAMKIILFDIKPILLGLVLTQPLLMLTLQNPLNWLGYLGIGLYALMIVDLSWLPGERVQEYVDAQHPYSRFILYGAVVTTVIMGVAVVLLLTKANNIFTVVLALSPPIMQLLLTDKGSVLTSVAISVYLSYLGSSAEYHTLNFGILCAIVVYTVIMHPSYINMLLLLLVHQSVINVRDSSTVVLMLLIWSLYVRSLWVKGKKGKMD